VLLPMLRDPAPEVRLKAAQALGEIGDPAAAESLAANLADPAWKASDGAARALVEIGQDVLPVLHALAETIEDPAVKERYRRVIGELSPAPAAGGD
jgi:HEAT repeat protein